MKKNVLPLYKTGWFYLLLFALASVFWTLQNGALNAANQWNRELLYQALPNTNLASSILRVRVSSEKMTAFTPIEAILQRFEQSGVGFMTISNPTFETKLKQALRSQPRSAAVVIATENVASAASFKDGPVKLGLISRWLRSYAQPDPVRWSADADVISAPLLIKQGAAAPLFWRNQQQLYPSLVTQLLLAGQPPNAVIDFKQGFDQQFEILDKSWPIGFSAEVYSAGEIPQLFEMEEAMLLEVTVKPSLLLFEDGSLQQSAPVARLLARMQQGNYLYQGWLVKTIVIGLALSGLAMCWWLIRLSIKRQLLVYFGYFLLLSIVQYVAFSQQQWLPILPLLLMMFPAALIFNAYRFEIKHYQHLQKMHNRLLGEAIPAFYQTQQFEKIRPLLEQTSPDLALLNKVFDVSLQAEAKNNRALAKRLLEWISQSQIKHQGCEQKLVEYQQQLEQESLDSTMVIGPGQTGRPSLTNPVYQIESFGRYQVEGILGKGAMGIVFQGVDPKINRHVAIKTLQLGDNVDEANFEEVKARFFREAETAGNLSHANIVTIYDVGEEGDLGYIAMDLLTGAPLSEFVKPENLLPAPLIYQFMIQMTDALDYAHRQNVVHRDIKPANMIYDDEIQRVSLTDFGIACMTDKSKTRTGTIMGSPYYMSPEQVLGERVDGRSDIFSLGVTFYQLLSGHLPFDGDSIASVAFHITKSKHQAVRQWNSKLPSSAVRITNKALQKDASKRYQSMQEFKAALVSALKRDYKREPLP